MREIELAVLLAASLSFFLSRCEDKLLSEPMVNCLAAGAWVLVAMLLVANIALRMGPLPLITSERHKLSELPQFSSPTQIPTKTLATVSDIASEAVPLPPTQPTDQLAPEVIGTIEPATHSEAVPLPPMRPTDQSALEVLGTVEPGTRSARAKAQAPQKRAAHEQLPINQPQSDTGRFSIKD